MSPRSVKSWGVMVQARVTDDAKLRDGRRARQVTVLVQATSAVKAADRIGCGVHHVRTYGSTTEDTDDLRALYCHPEGTVLVRTMSPGGSVVNGLTVAVRP